MGPRQTGFFLPSHQCSLFVLARLGEVPVWHERVYELVTCTAFELYMLVSVFTRTGYLCPEWAKPKLGVMCGYEPLFFFSGGGMGDEVADLR